MTEDYKRPPHLRDILDKHGMKGKTAPAFVPNVGKVTTDPRVVKPLVDVFEQLKAIGRR